MFVISLHFRNHITPQTNVRVQHHPNKKEKHHLVEELHLQIVKVHPLLRMLPWMFHAEQDVLNVVLKHWKKFELFSEQHISLFPKQVSADWWKKQWTSSLTTRWGTCILHFPLLLPKMGSTCIALDQFCLFMIFQNPVFCLRSPTRSSWNVYGAIFWRFSSVRSSCQTSDSYGSWLPPYAKITWTLWSSQQIMW